MRGACGQAPPRQRRTVDQSRLPSPGRCSGSRGRSGHPGPSGAEHPASRMTDKWPLRARKDKSASSTRTAAACLSTARAGDSGTRCSCRPSSVRPAPSRRASRSISLQRAPRTSPSGAAVRMAKRSASAACRSRGQRRHELAHVLPGKRRMVLDLCHLGLLGQHVLQVPAPPGRVLAGTPTVGRGIAQHRLDAPAHAGCRLRLGGPDRLENFGHMAGIDFAD